ncbi:MAG TPA: hypothetical protein VG899_08975 [Mycobacteriales bacterium]|nr:hypothetical protein [Mycobacteriales bacterium]
MIVISGILLLIAVVFLVIGLFGPLAWVYASIAVSVLSFVFLLVGVRQRRDVVLPAGAPAPRGLPASEEPSSADVTLVPAGGRRPAAGAAAAGAAAAAATAAVLEEREAEPPAARVERPRPAPVPARPTRPASPAASRLRSSSTTRPRAVLPARLAEAEGAGGAAKKTAAKKAAPAKTAAKKAAPAKTAAKKAAPAKATTAKKAAPAAKKTAAKKAAPAAKKTAAKKTAAKKSAG